MYDTVKVADLLLQVFISVAQFQKIMLSCVGGDGQQLEYFTDQTFHRPVY